MNCYFGRLLFLGAFFKAKERLICNFVVSYIARVSGSFKTSLRSLSCVATGLYIMFFYLFYRNNKFCKSVSYVNIIINCAIFFLFFTISSSTFASSLGVVGPTFLIQEEDFLSYIERRVALMQKNGEWQRVQKDLQSQVSQHVDRPSPVATLTKTTQQKTWHYDPSVIVAHDLQDHQGKVFAKAGTRVNPLSLITLHSALVFYDADDVDQVNWVKKINEKYSGKIKLILTKGSISSQTSLFHQPIYFDQQGRLTARFHIEHVPAMVEQEGLYLKISEIAV